MKTWKVSLNYSNALHPNDFKEGARNINVLEFNKNDLDSLIKNIYEKRINFIKNVESSCLDKIPVSPTQYLILQEAFRSDQFDLRHIGKIYLDRIYLFGVEIVPFIRGLILDTDRYKYFVGDEAINIGDIEKVVNYGF